MGHWKPRLPVIFNDRELGIFSDRPFTVVDGGAAGALFEPFSHVRDCVLADTFEPRGVDTIEESGHVNISAGLWSETTTAELHVAAEPSTSSIYPPNIPLLRRFGDRVGERARTTVEKKRVEVTSIDDQVAAGTMQPPNFIKLDVHSAEYEALLGARNSLSECLGILVETWHAPVHEGQPLNGEIETFLRQSGFQIHASHQQSAWRHARGGRTVGLDRPQLVGSESLYFRERIPAHLEVEFVALLELFGFSNRALQVLDDLQTCGSDERLARAAERVRKNQKVRQRWHLRVSAPEAMKVYAKKLLRA